MAKRNHSRSEADPESTPAWAKPPMQIEGYLFHGHGFRLIGIAIGIGIDHQNISIANPIPIAIAMVKIHDDDTCDYPETFSGIVFTKPYAAFKMGPACFHDNEVFMAYLRPLCFIFSLSLFMIAVSSDSSHAITVSEENEISREFMRYVRQNYPIIEDPEIAGYIQKLGDRILSTYPPQPFKYRFYVIKNEVYNAFAGPGAQIFIHSGLFEALENEAELAGILGHEIAHSTCRHISQNIDRSGKIGLGTLAGVAAGIFLGMYGDPAAGSALTVGALAGSQTLALSYSREDEMQADHEGLTRLYALGYSGHGLLNALGKIRSRQWFGQEQIPDYLTTHPSLESRIGYIQNWMDSRSLPGKPPVRDDFDFHLIKTRLKALYGPIEENRREFGRVLEKKPDDIFATYGLGILLARSGKMDEAIEYLKKTLEKRAFHLSIIKTLGKVYFDAGLYVHARGVFEGALAVVPQDWECNLYLGRIYTETGDYDKALDLLKPLVAEERGDAMIFYALGDLYARKGMLLESYYHLGLYYRQRLDLRNALIQFERALKNTRDPEMKKKIEDIIRDIRGEEQKEKKAEKKSGRLHGVMPDQNRTLSLDVMEGLL